MQIRPLHLLVLPFATAVCFSTLLLYVRLQRSAEFGQLGLKLTLSHTVSDMLSSLDRYDKDEVVDLLNRYYELLARMRYLPPSAIKYPPHSPPVNMTLAQELGLEPQVQELLQSLPYVDGYNNEGEFILGGSFADFRNSDVLIQSRDPGYADPEGDFDDENGPYVKPWVLVLNECGNHGSIMYLNTRNGHITMEGQDSGQSTDPKFEAYGYVERPGNRNAIEGMPSRPAKELFEDFMNKLVTLEWVPKGLENPSILYDYGEPYGEDFWESQHEYEDVKFLYKFYGWPNKFDGPAFDAALRRWEKLERVRYNIDDDAKAAGIKSPKLVPPGAEPDEATKRIYEQAWKKELQSNIDHESGNLRFNREHVNQEGNTAHENDDMNAEIAKLEADINILQERIKVAHTLPISVDGVVTWTMDESTDLSAAERR